MHCYFILTAKPYYSEASAQCSLKMIIKMLLPLQQKLLCAAATLGRQGVRHRQSGSQAGRAALLCTRSHYSY